MLEPAVAHKEELLRLFSNELYSQNYFYYVGGSPDTLPSIEPRDNHKQYAICDYTETGEKKVVGYVAYYLKNGNAFNFGLYGFDKGNAIIGIDLNNLLTDLVSKCHRVEWRMIGTNPVKKHYDKFCKEHGGKRVCLHDVVQDEYGKYYDEYIYEIVNKD